MSGCGTSSNRTTAAEAGGTTADTRVKQTEEADIASDEGFCRLLILPTLHNFILLVFFYERVNTLKPREETDSSASTGNSVCGAKGKLGRFNSFFLIRTDRVMNEHPPKVLRSKRCKVIFTS